MLDSLARPIDADAAVADRSAAKQGRPSVRLTAHDRVHAGWELAPGETIVWERRPGALVLAVRCFRLPIFAAYFGALALWGAAESFGGHADLGAILMPIATGLLTMGALLGTALLVSRTTTYLVTTERVILRYGAVVSRSLSIPFGQIGALRVAAGRSNHGDIAFALRSGLRIPYLKLWPHVRPWRQYSTEPLFRAVPGATIIATDLARRLDRKAARRN